MEGKIALLPVCFDADRKRTEAQNQEKNSQLFFK